jgi:hypothetical protein
MGSGAEHFLGVKKVAGATTLGEGRSSSLALPLPLVLEEEGTGS